MVDLKDFLSVKQFAHKLGYSTQGIRKAIEAGRIKGEMVGEQIVIHKDELKKMHKKKF